MPQPLSVLFVDAGPKRVAIPLRDLAETLRPLPCETHPGGPAHRLGYAVVRGRLRPVHDLAMLLGEPAGAPAGRWALMRHHSLVLAFQSVEGVGELSTEELVPTSGLIRGGTVREGRSVWLLGDLAGWSRA